MGKSECKIVLRKLVPGAFAPPEKARVVLEDSCVRIQKMVMCASKSTGRITIDQLVDRFWGPVIRALANDTHMYVTLFDKPSHVTWAKHPEQRARDDRRAGTKRGADGRPVGNRETGGTRSMTGRLLRPVDIHTFSTTGEVLTRVHIQSHVRSMSTCSRDRRFPVCMYIFAPFSRERVGLSMVFPCSYALGESNACAGAWYQLQ